MRIGVLVGMTIVAGAVGGILYMSKKGKTDENDISATVFDVMLKDDGKKKEKLNCLDLSEIKRKISKEVNRGVGKLKVITDAWEAHENGIAKAGVEKTEFERAFEQPLDLSDLVDGKAEKWDSFSELEGLARNDKEDGELDYPFSEEEKDIGYKSIDELKGEVNKELMNEEPHINSCCKDNKIKEELKEVKDNINCTVKGD